MLPFSSEATNEFLESLSTTKLKSAWCHSGTSCEVNFTAWDNADSGNIFACENFIIHNI